LNKPQTHRHRFDNNSNEPLIFIGFAHEISPLMTMYVKEVQSGAYVGEDDIVRFDDHYGRPTIQ